MPATYIKLATVKVTSPAASVTFSNIDQTYTDLVVSGYASGNQGGSGWNAGFGINGLALDDSNNSGGSPHAYNTDLYGAIYVGYANRSTTVDGGQNSYTMSPVYAYFPEYTSTSQLKTVVTYSGFPTASNQASGASCGGATWFTTSAITSLTFGIPSNNIATDSTLVLYGVKYS